MNMTPTHDVQGTSAYLDTFSGLIPCIVLGYEPNRTNTLQVRITRTKQGYKAGEIVSSSTNWTPPKDRIKRRKYSTYIMPYRYKPAA